jgi:hypothetical protein
MLYKSIVAASLAASGLCASLQQVSNFGNNPSGIQMYIYVPDKVASNPAIIVGVGNKLTNKMALTKEASPLRRLWTAVV